MIGFYTRLISLILLLLVTLYAYPVVFLHNLRYALEYWGGSAETITWLSSLLSKLSAPVAVLFGWGLAALVLCGLLHAWLSSKRAGLIATSLAALLWSTAIFSYRRGGEIPEVFGYLVQAFGIPPTIASPVLLLTLILGIPILTALWYLRPFAGRKSTKFLDKYMTAIFLSVFWLLLWLMLTFGLREHRLGVILLLSAASGAVFVFGLHATSGFLLPHPAGGDRGRLIFDYLRDRIISRNFPSYVVVDEPFEEDKLEKRVPGSRFAGGGLDRAAPLAPGFVLSDCDHAVVISSGTKFKGVGGPGVTELRYADQVVQTIDLRPQLHAFHVEAHTKDGIKIRVLAFTPCTVNAGDQKPRLGEPLPYKKSEAFKAIRAQRTEHSGQQTRQRKWHELPTIVAERVLQDIIGEYTFDDLCAPNAAEGTPPRVSIAEAFRERVRAELEPLGIDLVGGGISDLQPADPRVYVKRAESWQAEWMRTVTLKKAQGRAEWLRTVERARAEAHADLILTLGSQLEQLSASRAEVRPKMAIDLFVKILDQLILQQPTLREIVPGETLQALGEIRKSITGTE